MTKRLIAANPDVLDFADVTGCSIDVDEDRREIMRDTENGEVSYVPPRYEYSYDFDVVINVRNPYFDEIRFRLNSSSVDMEVRGNITPRPENNIQYREYKEMGEEIKKALTEVREQVREEAVSAAAPKTAMTCPWCGATTIPDANGCCEYCGGAMG